MTDRAARVVACARGWIGTPFHHQGRRKGAGCDCIGLVVGVARELELESRLGGLLSYADVEGYGREPDGERLREALEAHLWISMTPSPGDVLLMSVRGQPRHVGILGECGGSLTLIHAYAQARKVVEHAYDTFWGRATMGIFRF